MWTGKMAEFYSQAQGGDCPQRTISMSRPMMRTEKRTLPRLAEARRLDHKGEKRA